MTDRKLKIDIRREKILELLKQNGKVQVSELSHLLGATPVTIRNDLDALEHDQYLIRVQGGALLKPWPHDAAAEMDRLEEKQAIAQELVRQIPDGSTLFINAGTTTLCVARALKDHHNLNVVTNSLSSAMALGHMSNLHVMLLGGEINTQHGFTYGADAEEQLRRYRADCAILSIDGVSANGGITSFLPEETTINRMMIAQSSRVIIAADYTKIGRTGFSHICDATPSVHVVTDGKSSRDAIAELEALGISVTIAP